ncbi:MAG: hypothetical protein WA130_10820 [Candidatus Methanoperedens sp.]
MLFEHLIYSTAIAIIAGMLWFKRTGRDPSCIIIASAYAPDFDIVAGELFKKFDMNILTAPIRHWDFHNIAVLLLFATVAALVLRFAGMRFGESFLLAGFGARKPKNERFFSRQYRYLWQGEAERWGIGMIDDGQDLMKLMHVCIFKEGIGFIFNEVIYSLCTKCLK